jgi:predicted AAA+ superfamily ATPase
MDDAKLIEILSTWNFWDRELPKIIKRDVALPEKLSNKLVLTIQGIRRSGKSTFLTQIVEHYKLNKKHCLFINFEDPRLSRNLDYKLLENIVNIFTKLNPNRKLYFFLDEIQNVSNWEKWIRTKLERPDDNHFILTGSNSSLLSGEFSSVLTGRHINLELFPMSFSEIKKNKAKLVIDSYLDSGGFPGAVLNTENKYDSDKLLQQYFNDIVEKDIRENLRSSSSNLIKQVIQMVYESSGSEISLRRISGATGLAVDTISNYLNAAIASYLIFSCEFFAYSAKKRANKNKKYYAIDPGLRRSVITKTGMDKGKSFEIVVYLELRKKFREVYYWKDEGEVDFVVETKNGLLPLQVSYSDIQARHQEALENFYENFPNALEAVLITPSNFLTEVKRLKQI